MCSRDHVCPTVLFFPFHHSELAITGPWKEHKHWWTWHVLSSCSSTVKCHLPVKELVRIHYSYISLLILLVRSYLKLSKQWFMLENEPFVLETVTRVAFHLTVLSEHDFSAGSTQDDMKLIQLSLSKSYKYRSFIQISGYLLL